MESASNVWTRSKGINAASTVPAATPAMIFATYGLKPMSTRGRLVPSYTPVGLVRLKRI